MTVTIYTVGASTGGVAITDHIKFGGIKWQRADVDGEDAGRPLDGLMHRDRVDIKYRLDITCKPLTLSQASTVLAAIEPEFVDVVYDDPRVGSSVRRTVYSNNVPATFCMTRDGVDYWEGIAFPLIEQ